MLFCYVYTQLTEALLCVYEEWLVSMCTPYMVGRCTAVVWTMFTLRFPLRLFSPMLVRCSLIWWCVLVLRISSFVRFCLCSYMAHWFADVCTLFSPLFFFVSILRECALYAFVYEERTCVSLYRTVLYVEYAHSLALMLICICSLLFGWIRAVLPWRSSNFARISRFSVFRKNEICVSHLRFEYSKDWLLLARTRSLMRVTDESPNIMHNWRVIAQLLAENMNWCTFNVFLEAGNQYWR